MVRCFAVLVLAVSLAAGAGCAHDLPGWKVASTEHFRVYTDQKPRSFESLLGRLEHVYAGLKASLFSGDIAATEVFLFSAHEFDDLLGPVGGVAITGIGKGNASTLVLFEGWDPAFIDNTAAHELAHAFIGNTYRRPPVWFNEGLATYAESIMVRENAVLLGSNKVHVAALAAGRRLVDVSNLFGATPKDFHASWEAAQYTTAWAVVHYIWHGEGKSLRGRFDAFGAALSNEAGSPGGSQRAWQATFPDVPVSEIDGRLRDHMHEVFGKGRDSVVGFRFKRPERPATVLRPAEMSYVDQVRAQLRKFRRPDKL